MIRFCGQILLLNFIFTACSASEITLVNLNKRKDEMEFVQTYDLYKPIFVPNGGSKKSTIFNAKKVQREKEFIAILKSIPKPKEPEDIVGIESEADKAIQNAIYVYNQKIVDLENRLGQIDIKKKGAEEEFENILIEINNLICNYQEGITLLEKKVQRLFGDITFQTGSAVVSGNGKKSINSISSTIEKEVQRWRAYVNSCNKKIFENDLYVVIINIDGYADQRGNENSNLILSKNRAKAVEKLLIAEITNLVKNKNIRIIFDRIYTEGYGEELPPGAVNGHQDDQNRRVCIISYIVGPSRYLGE
jgi:outer membrane protein OmpA-like peptidoglycan-associated protein